MHLQQAHPLLELAVRLIQGLAIDHCRPITRAAITTRAAIPLDDPPAPPATSVVVTAVIR
jgi:hypothetical protein